MHSISQESKELIAKVNVFARSIPLIEKGQELDEIRQGDCRSLSAAFWGTIVGVAQEISINPDIPCPSPEWIVAILKTN